jgi:hypothetical protein
MSSSHTETVNFLKKIAAGGDSSVETARSLESAILSEFTDADEDPRFDELLHVLASYEPVGGDYLYNGRSLADECRQVLRILEREFEEKA